MMDAWMTRTLSVGFSASAKCDGMNGVGRTTATGRFGSYGLSTVWLRRGRQDPGVFDRLQEILRHPANRERRAKCLPEEFDGRAGSEKGSAPEYAKRVYDCSVVNPYAVTT